LKFSYDEDSKEFKEALESFNNLISSDSDAKDMLKHVAFHVTRFGIDTMVEGVGYIGQKDSMNFDEPYSGIEIVSGYDDFDFEIV